MQLVSHHPPFHIYHLAILWPHVLSPIFCILSAKSKQDMNLLPEVIRRPFETAVEVERQTMLEELNSRRLHKFESLWTDGTPEGEILEIARDLWDVSTSSFPMLQSCTACIYITPSGFDKELT